VFSANRPNGWSPKGGLPYIAASGTTVYLAHQAGLAASGIITHIDPGVAHTILDQALTFQVTYGAVMLSFLGEPHEISLAFTITQYVTRARLCCTDRCIALGHGIRWPRRP
jgi:hypothetical protein